MEEQLDMLMQQYLEQTVMVDESRNEVNPTHAHPNPLSLADVVCYLLITSSPPNPVIILSGIICIGIEL